MTTPPTPGFWTRRILDGVSGAAEALFPPNDLGAPDWRQADVAARTLIWMNALPPPQRRLVTTLWLVLELVAPWALLVGFGRFSRLPIERRTRAIRRWRASRLPPLQLLGMGIKAALTMIYASHPAVLRHMGQFAVCEHPGDPVQLPLRPNALSEPLHRAEVKA